MNVFKMAWRNVWRNYRRSGVTIAAMTIALVAELLYSGLVTGLVMGMEEDAISIDSGDIQMFAPQYLTRPSLYDVVEDHEAIIDQLEEEGFRATPRLFAGGLAASGEASAGVGFIGLDAQRDAEVLDLHQAIGQGAWLDPGDPLGVVVGRGLARTLDLELGSELLVLSQGADGSIANELLTIRGILMSVAASMDRSMVLMNEATFRELMVLPEGAHKLLIRRPANTELVAAADVVRSVAGIPSAAEDAAAKSEARAWVKANPDATPPAPPEYPVAVKDWKQLNPFLAQYLETVASVVVVIYFIVYMAVAILILNAMLMAVFERIREFGVLKAIGYGPGRVLSIMLLEGFFQAVVAVVLGSILAAPCMWYLSTYGIDVGVLGGMEMAGLTMPAIWRSYYSIETSGVPVVLLFVIVFGAVLWPAAKAAWISPVEAMHHQ